MIKTKAILFLIFCSPLFVFSQDGLDTNSFDNPAVQKNNQGPNVDQPSNESDQFQDNGLKNTESSNNLDQQPTNKAVDPPTESQKLNFSENENTETSSPSEPFDQGVNPLETQNTPEGLSLNPATDALKQEYYPSFIYDDRGRKDPFEPVFQNVEKVITEEIVTVEQDQKLLEGLSKYEVSALKVSAILIGKGKPKALVRDPSGIVYVIHENDIVGRNNGVVKKIRSSQIVIVEARDQKDGDRLYTTQVLSVAK